MSMISSLIDELNKSADEWNGNNLFELARMCREAADTITELRGALQVASVDYRHLSDENTKLRELVRDVWHLFTEHGAVHPCALPVVDTVRDRMRELGVEVDG